MTRDIPLQDMHKPCCSKYLEAQPPSPENQPLRTHNPVRKLAEPPSPENEPLTPTHTKTEPLGTKETIQLTHAVISMVSARQKQHDDDVTFKSRFSRCFKKVRTRHTWTVIMVTLGTLYMLINAGNALQLWDDNLQYELVVGPPMYIMKLLIAVFTAIGTVIWIPETINTVSVYCHGGFPLVSLTIEMMITILVVHIPIAALNYFTSQCRASHTSMLQVMSGACSISYIFIRMIWFAHLQGQKLKKNDKREMKQGLFMLMCALFSCSMAFQIMSWRATPASELMAEYTNNVSIIFLKTKFKNNEQVPKHNATQLFIEQGYIKGKPYLLKNMTHLVNAGSQGMVAYYVCNYDNVVPANTTLTLPYFCDEFINGSAVKLIKFRIRYVDGNDMLPFGEIHFNYALVTAVNISIATDGQPLQWNSMQSLESLGDRIASSQNNSKSQTPKCKSKKQELYEIINEKYAKKTVVTNVTKTPEVERLEDKQWIAGFDFYGNVTDGMCTDGKKTLKRGWNLWFLVACFRKSNVFIQSPWISSCTTPFIRYNPDISVCGTSL